MKNLTSIILVAISLLASGAYAQVSRAEVIVGIGATLQKLSDGTVQVDILVPSAPAERSGLAVGDIITAVKSLPDSPVADVRSLPLSDVVALIRGPVGVPVELSFTRGNSGPFALSIVREKFEIQDPE